MLGKKTLWILPSSFYKMSEKGRLYPGLLKMLHPLNYLMADTIVVYSESIIKDWGLEKYSRKIRIASQHFIDLGNYKIVKAPAERGHTIGFLGRFSEEKGILNFIQSMPLILRENPECSFTIIGDGPLRPEVTRFIESAGIDDKVELTGWIHHYSLPEYLNKLLIIVIPSYTEGLPNAMIEAMACGAVIVASPVGAIPDIIRDGENGYILPDNSPQTISRLVTNVIGSGDEGKISANGRQTVTRQFVYESCLENFKKIL